MLCWIMFIIIIITRHRSSSLQFNCFVCLRNDDDDDDNDNGDDDNDDDSDGDNNDDNDDDNDDDDGNINGDVNGDVNGDDYDDDDNDGRWVQPSIRSQSYSILHFAFCFQQITCLPALTMMN